MSARAIVSGVLFRPPAEKTTKTGRPFVFATVREGSGDAVRWWKIFVFHESAIEEILRLGDGEPIAVTGEFDCENYALAGGQSRLSWKLTADAVLSARAKRKPKTEKPRAIAAHERSSGRELAAASWAAPSDRGGAHVDDDLTF